LTNANAFNTYFTSVAEKLINKSINILKRKFQAAYFGNKTTQHYYT